MESVFSQAALPGDILIDCICSNMRWYVLVECRIEECNGMCTRKGFDRCTDHSEGCTIMSERGRVCT